MTRKERIRIAIAALEWAGRLVDERRGYGHNGHDRRWKVSMEIAAALRAEIERLRKSV